MPDPNARLTPMGAPDDPDDMHASLGDELATARAQVEAGLAEAADRLHRAEASEWSPADIPMVVVADLQPLLDLLYVAREQQHFLDLLADNESLADNFRVRARRLSQAVSCCSDVHVPPARSF